MIYSKYLSIKGGKLQRAEWLDKCSATSHGPVREVGNQEKSSVLMAVPYIYTLRSWLKDQVTYSLN